MEPNKFTGLRVVSAYLSDMPRYAQDGPTAIIEAVTRGTQAQVKAVLQKDPSLINSMIENKTPFIASLRNYGGPEFRIPAITNLLLNTPGINVNLGRLVIQEADGHNQLHTALVFFIRHRDVRMVQKLLQLGANITREEEQLVEDPAYDNAQIRNLILNHAFEVNNTTKTESQLGGKKYTKRRRQKRRKTKRRNMRREIYI